MSRLFKDLRSWHPQVQFQLRPIPRRQFVNSIPSQMPPKRGTKRSTSPTGEDETTKRPAVKRSKSSTNLDTSAYPWTNKGIPESVSFEPSGEKIRISAWNVCGLMACWKKGFSRYIQAEDADILILTETKVAQRPADPLLNSKYPHQYWSMAAKQGYAGTAVLSKHKPLSVSYTLNHSVNEAAKAPKLEEDDVKGRLVTLEFEKCWVIGTYVPNAGDALKNMNRKVAWQVAFEAHLRKLDAIKPVIWAGDLNVAPTAKDIRNDKSNWNKTAGYTEKETSAFKRVLMGPPAPPPTEETVITAKVVEAHTVTRTATDDAVNETATLGQVVASVAVTKLPGPSEQGQGGPGPMIDVWRKLHPHDEHYTYFSYRFGARQKGMGWRIDHYVVSERFFSKVAACEIRNEIWGASDHCPVVLDIEGPI